MNGRSEATGVVPAAETPCAQCPWRTENQGKRHPDGWYTKANRTRLWSKLRRGEAMTCHPTDPTNPIPEGARAVPDGTTTRECTGAIILQQREVMVVQDMEVDMKRYRRERPRGMTREGFGEILARAVFGGVPVIGGQKMTLPDLNQPVSMEGLPWPYQTPTV